MYDISRAATQKCNMVDVQGMDNLKPIFQMEALLNLHLPFETSPDIVHIFNVFLLNPRVFKQVEWRFLHLISHQTSTFCMTKPYVHVDKKYLVLAISMKLF